MATETKPDKPQALPAAEPQPAPQGPVLDPLRPCFGDRIAFAIWIACALFMGALVTYDTVMGLFR
jgi:hypothetical protein